MKINKTIKKLIKIIIILAFAILIIYSHSIAAIDTNITISNKYKNEFNDPGNYIFGVVQVVAIAASVIGLSIIGIKYMAGSVEEKAEYKKTLIYYLVGAILSFGIIKVLEFIYKVINDAL